MPGGETSEGYGGPSHWRERTPTARRYARKAGSVTTMDPANHYDNRPQRFAPSPRCRPGARGAGRATLQSPQISRDRLAALTGSSFQNHYVDHYTRTQNPHFLRETPHSAGDS